MYNTFKTKYPFINGCRLHLTPNTMHLLSMSGSNNVLRYINHSGGLVLQQCNGKQSIGHILNYFLQLYPKIADVEEKTIGFLHKAIESGDICLYDAPCDTESVVCGSVSYYTPINASLELTSKCNERCQHCYRSCESISDEIELPKEEMLKVIETLIRNGVYNVELTGGDPFMNANIEEIVKFCLINIGSVSIITNAIKLREQFVDTLDSFRYKLFWQISIESIEPNIHDKFRGLKGSHGITLQKVKYLIKRGHKVRVAANMTPYNIHTILDTADYVYNTLGAYEFLVSPILAKGRAADYIDSWGLSGSELDSFYYTMKDIVDTLNERYPPKKARKDQGPEGRCGCAKDTTVVSPDGNVRPCVICDDKKLVLGNLLHDSYDSIFGGSVARSLQKLNWPDHTKESCANCEHIQWCEHCIVRAMELNIDNFTQGKNICGWIVANNLESIVASQSKLSL